MKAIVRSEYGSPDVLQLKEIAKPVPKDNEVLVRVHASSVNMADVDYLLGRPRIARLGTGFRKPRNTGLGLEARRALNRQARGIPERLPDRRD